MSSTRRAPMGSHFRQEKYASSAEFEIGLNAILVARRCSLLTDPKEIELIWFLQHLSHQQGGLKKVAEDNFAIFPKQIRKSAAFLDQTSDLLREICLNPSTSPSAIKSLSCKNLYHTLQMYCSHVAETSLAGLVKTEIGEVVIDSLNYAEHQKALVLIEGNARIGKTFATKAWCEACPGKRRYVQAPSSNDMTVFFRTVAKALGLAASYTRKANELRVRISDVLQTGQLMLVIDEAHYLFPQINVRRALPARINWLLTELVNFGVAVALISTPQFTTSQRVIEKNTHWASEQLIGRMARYTRLPERLEQNDLEAVARYHLPEGDRKSISALVGYAQASRKYLAGIDHATKAARYEAQIRNRTKVTFDDIKNAIATNVMPSDFALREALAPVRKRSVFCGEARNIKQPCI